MRRIARSIGPSIEHGPSAAVAFLCMLLAGSSAARAESRPSPSIGRMLMVGFQGDVLAPEHPLLQHIRNKRVGGVILYNTGSQRGNITSQDQVRALTKTLREAGGKAFLIAVDEEGGGVRHVSKLLGPRGPTSARYLGARDDEALTAQTSGQTAEMLQLLGINLNLAPDIDLDVNPLSPAIGAQYRSYGPDTLTVATHARQFIEAHRQRGVATVCKHFPGHGSAAEDSHLGAADVTLTWSPRELAPYRRLIPDGSCRAVMVGHLSVGHIDPANPASLSVEVVDGLLRNELGFDGVVISDDLQMLTRPESLEERMKRAIIAGVDIVLIAQPTVGELETVIEAMKDWAESGEISKDRITASLRRLDAFTLR